MKCITLLTILAWLIIPAVSVAKNKIQQYPTGTTKKSSNFCKQCSRPNCINVVNRSKKELLKTEIVKKCDSRTTRPVTDKPVNLSAKEKTKVAIVSGSKQESSNANTKKTPSIKAQNLSAKEKMKMDVMKINIDLLFLH